MTHCGFWESDFHPTEFLIKELELALMKREEHNETYISMANNYLGNRILSESHKICLGKMLLAQERIEIENRIARLKENEV